MSLGIHHLDSMVMTSSESHGAKFREIASAGTRSDLDPEAVCVSGPDSEAVCLSGSEMLKGRIFRNVISAHVRLVHAHPKGHGRDHDIHPETVCVSDSNIEKPRFQ